VGKKLVSVALVILLAATMVGIVSSAAGIDGGSGDTSANITTTSGEALTRITCITQGILDTRFIVEYKDGVCIFKGLTPEGEEFVDHLAQDIVSAVKTLADRLRMLAGG
jgi:high-affinity K+ transport system ATPase subunit B